MPPPPPPPQAPAREELPRPEPVEELEALETEDLLALCMRFRGSTERLRLYLRMFQARPGPRAQFAASLICYDLARKGDKAAQHQFLDLAPTLIGISRDARLVDELVRGDFYLFALWSDCKSALERLDPREAPSSAGGDGATEVQLLDEEEFDEVVEVEEQEPDSPEARQKFLAMLFGYFGQSGAGTLARSQAFATSTAAELERLERFLQGARVQAERVSTARGLACLGPLFLAAHLRRHNLFGTPNERRQTAVREGLLAFPKDLGSLAHAAALFEFVGPSVSIRFGKVTELLIDFLVFCRESRLDPLALEATERYIAADRQPPPLLALPDERRRR